MCCFIHFKPQSIVQLRMTTTHEYDNDDDDDIVRFKFELDIFRTRAFYYYSK